MFAASPQIRKYRETKISFLSRLIASKLQGTKTLSSKIKEKTSSKQETVQVMTYSMQHEFAGICTT
jgi:hypothetical protein